VKDTIYYKQAELVLKILPFVNSEKIFAVKGGNRHRFDRSARDTENTGDLFKSIVNQRREAISTVSKNGPT
jgi:hypothetical protein